MALTIGDKAPAITGTLHDDTPITPDTYQGQRVLLYFYPKDNTPGCTAQACSLRDAYADINDRGITIIGVSPDSAKSHTNFRQKHELPFPLIADKEKELATAYGTWVMKTRCGKTSMGIQRTSFLIDENGNIAHIFDKVKTKEHAQQVLDVLDKLNW